MRQRWDAAHKSSEENNPYAHRWCHICGEVSTRLMLTQQAYMGAPRVWVCRDRKACGWRAYPDRCVVCGSRNGTLIEINVWFGVKKVCSDAVECQRTRAWSGERA